MKALLRAATASSRLAGKSVAAARLQSSWTCLSCRHRTQRTIPLGRIYTQQRLYSSSSDGSTTTTTTQGLRDKPYYVTTPIFYVNAGKSCSICTALLAS